MIHKGFLEYFKDNQDIHSIKNRERIFYFIFILFHL